MKIAYVIHSCNNSGGMERILAVKANYLINKGFDIYIIALNSLEDSNFFNFDDRITFHNLRIPRNKLKYKKMFVEKLSDYLNNIQPDITISTGLYLTNYVYESNDKSKKILEIHFAKYRRKYELATFDKYFFGRIISDLYSLKKMNIAKKYDRFIVLTEEDKSHWRYLNNIDVIPNPVTIKPSNHSDNTNKRIIAVGRYTYQKGFDKLINIWAIIHKKYPDWTLCLFGGGHKKEQLKMQAKRLGILSSIEFNNPSKNIAKEFVESSILVMTSRYEGFGLVLVEAMSSGLPVVSYACKCGPRDIIHDGVDGFLINYNDKNQFVNKLSTLIDDRELRQTMGKNAIKSMERFNLDTVMSKWMRLFESLCL